MIGQLDAELCSVAELFDVDEAIYTVPIYQRNFSWGAEQIEQLISDVLDSLDEDDDGYFLGNLIVTKRPGRRTDYEVIDGQQRLTTLYLLLTILHANGDNPYSAHRDRLRYESRVRASDALRRIAAEGSRHASQLDEIATDEDSAILEAYNVMGQYLKQHEQLRDGPARDRFADFLRHRVTVVRAVLPEKTDLNRYFEIMNTRGQQLQQVDIVKARLMSRLPDETQRACFAWIWDSCADMDSYLQMSLTRGSTDRRSEIFGDDWSWLRANDFHQLLDVHRALQPEATQGMPSAPLTLDAALAKYATIGAPSADEDVTSERFRSTIEFPSLLLHVLKVVMRDDQEHEVALDDKRLIKRFDEALAAVDATGQAHWVREFSVALLKLRTLFDAFILKRQYPATSGDDGDWSLRRLARRVSNRRSVPAYVNTFSSPDSAGEDDIDVDTPTRQLLLLESMLRVTYTSPRSMHWITTVLRTLIDANPSEMTAARLVDVLQDYTREKVRAAFFTGEQPQGFDIARIVFTYVDYLLLGEHPNPQFRFIFRNSIEHFFPQKLDDQMSGPEVSPSCLNLFGNLALVSVGANSKFSNSLPMAKATTFRSTIETQSPKLGEMARITRDHEGWGDQQVLDHHHRVIRLLREALSLADPADERSISS